MSCTFWNLRRRRAALSAQKAMEEGNAAKQADKAETEKKPPKRGGEKSGK